MSQNISDHTLLGYEQPLGACHFIGYELPLGACHFMGSGLIYDHPIFPLFTSCGLNPRGLNPG